MHLFTFFVSYIHLRGEDGGDTVSENENKNEINENNNLANTDFMREKIKARPISRKKLLRRTIITVSLAVVFGGVACITFLLLQPVINNTLYPENQPEPVTFPEETESDEMTPEDMYVDEEEIAADAAAQAAEAASTMQETNKEQLQSLIESYKFTAEDYNEMNTALKEVAKNASKSVVTVTAVTSDYNWFNDTYESSGDDTGVIVADNGTELMILTDADNIKDAETIDVTFSDSSVHEASLKMSDTITGYCIIAVSESQLSDATLSEIKVADLGSSNSGNLTGSAVIAIGKPIGVDNSVSYGIITSEKTSIDLADTNYKLLTTDMYGSSNGSGAIINLSGQIIGIISTDYNASDQSSRICAVGITELKDLIEALSNKTGKSYLGIHGTSIPTEVQVQQGVPAGAYITKTDMDSPAMEAGLQSGDIIVALDGVEIPSYEVLVSKLNDTKPGDDVVITIKRSSPDDYIEVDIEATLTSATTE